MLNLHNGIVLKMNESFLLLYHKVEKVVYLNIKIEVKLQKEMSFFKLKSNIVLIN